MTQLARLEAVPAAVTGMELRFEILVRQKWAAVELLDIARQPTGGVDSFQPAGCVNGDGDACQAYCVGGSRIALWYVLWW